MMVGTVFQKPFDDFQHNMEQYLEGLKYFDLTIYDLYDKFVGIKFQKLYEEIDFKDPRYSEEYEEKLKRVIKQHGKVALNELFPYDDVPQELVSEDEWEELLKSVTSIKEKTGLIAQVEDNRLFFVHRTFAEYFAATLLAEALLLKGTRQYYAARDFLYRILTGPIQPVNLMEFLNYKLVATSEHASIFKLAIGGTERSLIYSDGKKGKWSAIYDSANCKDALGRTPVHLLCCFKCFHYLDSELKRSSKMLWLSEVDDLFKWTPAHYAIACHVCEIQSINDEQCIVNSTSIPSRETSKDMYGVTPLMIAVRRGCYFSCVQTYLADLPLEIDVKDSKGNTALHYALNRFDEEGDKFAEKLIKIGADILIPNRRGEMALDIILTNKKDDLLKLVREVYENNTSFRKVLLDRLTSDTELYEFMNAMGFDALGKQSSLVVLDLYIWAKQQNM